jgi:hypothetical protein
MNKAMVFLSGFTAFIITACGALGVVLVGNKPSLLQIGAAVALGAVAGAKDIRSLLKLPPVEGEVSEGKKPTGTGLGLWLMFWFGICLFVSGCAGSYDRQVFKIEAAAVGTADGAMKGYALYYKAATNNPAAFNRTLESLTLEREQAKALAVQVGAAGEMVETLRLSYATNSAVEPALKASVATLIANMENIVTFTTNVFHLKPTN